MNHRPFPAVPDETGGRERGDGADVPAVAAQPLRRRDPPLRLLLAAPVVHAAGRRPGLEPAQLPVAALRGLSFPHTEKLCFSVSDGSC